MRQDDFYKIITELLNKPHWKARIKEYNKEFGELFLLELIQETKKYQTGIQAEPMESARQEIINFTEKLVRRNKYWIYKDENLKWIFSTVLSLIALIISIIALNKPK